MLRLDAGDPPVTDVEAVRRMWQELRTVHVSSIMGCGCGMALAHVSAADFELDLLAFLADRYKQEPYLVSLLQREDNPKANLSAALAFLSTGNVEPALCRRILTDITKSITSFATSTGNGGFFCATC